MSSLSVKDVDNLDFLTDEWFTEFFHPTLEWNKEDLWCVAEINCKPVALGFVRGWHDNWPEKVLGLVVHPDYREMGIGKLLVLLLQINTRFRGEKKLRLHVSPDNIPASLLYTNQGFETEGRRDDGEFIMRKEL